MELYYSFTLFRITICVAEVGAFEADTLVSVESLVKYHPCCDLDLTLTVIRLADRVWWVV